MTESVASAATAAGSHARMLWIPAGEFTMGSDAHYPDERPTRRRAVDGFWIDPHPVTNARFAEFVAATGHVTVAELVPDPASYPDAIPEMLYAGSLVFAKPSRAIDMRHNANWWSFRRGADWRHPYGPESSLDGLEDHPVVHVAYADVEAYAVWAGKQIPTEAEWEFAARGGVDGASYAWGEELMPGGRHFANVWQGRFPYENLCEDGYERTSPVDAFPANGYGVSDMIGNTWEWTSDWYRTTLSTTPSGCCSTSGPRKANAEDSYDPAQPAIRIPRKVLKGGSHLCAPNYCRRYRPAARQPQPVDTSACHVGFRCIVRAAQSPGPA